MMGPNLLGRLLDEHASALVLYARQWCAVPEDVVQEAFIKLAGASPEPRNPVAWLYRVVRNAALSAARSARRRQRHEQTAAEQAAVWFVPSSAAGVEAEEVTAALQAVPVEQREVIVAHLWGGRTFEEIAAFTGTSASSAHRLYSAGLTALRERLGVSCLKKSTTPNEPHSKQP